MRKFLSLFLILTIFISVPAVAQEDEMLRLFLQNQKGQRLYRKLENNLNRDIAALNSRNDLTPKQRDLEITKKIDEFYAKSRQLTEKYRKPLVDKMVSEANKGLPGNKKIKPTAGSDLYIKGPDGKYTLNPNHRGWKGDFDFGGSPEAVYRLEKISKDLQGKVDNLVNAKAKALKASGYSDAQINRALKKKYGFSVGTEVTPGYLNVNGAEMTINIEGSMGNVGSSTHRDQILIDSLSAETYSSIPMEKNQPAKKSVEIANHRKKAIKGLKKSPGDLLKPQNSDALQGLVKGTLKSAGVPGSHKNNYKKEFLDNVELSEILKRNGFDMDAKVFRKKLEIIKTSPKMSRVVLRDVDMGKFQRVSEDIMNAAQAKADNIAKTELEANRKRINDLKKKAQELELKGNKLKAKELKTRAEHFEKLQLDSKTRMEYSKKGFDANYRGNGLDELNPILKNAKPVDTPNRINAPDAEIPKSVQNLGKAARIGGKAGGIYMKILDIKGNIEDLNAGINRALDEEKTGDSGLKTWGKSVGYTMMNMSGIPAMSEALVQAHKEAERKLREDIAINPSLTEADFDRLISSYRREADLKLARQMAKGITEEITGLPGNTGKWLGELSAKDDLNKANKLFKTQNHKLKMFQYRHNKLQELQYTMKDLIVNGYDPDKARKKNDLLDYFYGLHAKGGMDSELDTFTSRWIEKIEVAKDEYKVAMERQLKLREQQQELRRIQEQLEREKAELEAMANSEDDFEIVEVDREVVEKNRNVIQSQAKRSEYNQQRSVNSRSSTATRNEIAAEKSRAAATQSYAQGMQDFQKDLTRVQVYHNATKYGGMSHGDAVRYADDMMGAVYDKKGPLPDARDYRTKKPDPLDKYKKDSYIAKQIGKNQYEVIKNPDEFKDSPSNMCRSETIQLLLNYPDEIAQYIAGASYKVIDNYIACGGNINTIPVYPLYSGKLKNSPRARLGMIRHLASKGLDINALYDEHGIIPMEKKSPQTLEMFVDLFIQNGVKFDKFEHDFKTIRPAVNVKILNNNEAGGMSLHDVSEMVSTYTGLNSSDINYILSNVRIVDAHKIKDQPHTIYNPERHISNSVSKRSDAKIINSILKKYIKGYNH